MSMFFRVTFENGDEDDVYSGRDLFRITSVGLVAHIQLMMVYNTGPRFNEAECIGQINGLQACEEFIGLVSR